MATPLRFTSDRLRDAEIVVVGAGVVGAALAYRLAQAGARVSVVERRFAGAGTSGSSFAWLNGHDKTPRDYHRLNLLSIRDHQDLADEVGGSWVQVPGGIHWAESGTPAADRLRDAMDRLRRWGARVDRTTPEIAMRELEPDAWIDPDRVSEVYAVQREGYLDGVSMAHGAIHAAVRQYGATFERAEVVGFRKAGDAMAGVLLDDGRELPADVVVNAAGPDAARVAVLASAEVPVDRQIGLLVSTEPAPVCLQRLLHTAGLRVRPYGAGRLLLQDEDLDAFAVEGQPAPLDLPAIQRAMERARAVLPGLALVQPEAARVGIRPVPRDGYPIVGFEPAVAGLYTVVTHSGITLAARLALLVAEDLAGGDASELGPYRPGRFATLSASRSVGGGE